MADDKAAIEARLAASQAVFDGADYDKAVEFFTEDARVLIPDKDVIIGRTNILAFYKEMEKLAKPKAEDVTTAEVEVLSETYALSTGEFTMVVGPNRNKNKILTVWKKVDGVWYFYRSVYNNAAK